MSTAEEGSVDKEQQQQQEEEDEEEKMEGALNKRVEDIAALAEKFDEDGYDDDKDISHVADGQLEQDVQAMKQGIEHTKTIHEDIEKRIDRLRKRVLILEQIEERCLEVGQGLRACEARASDELDERRRKAKRIRRAASGDSDD